MHVGLEPTESWSDCFFKVMFLANYVFFKNNTQWLLVRQGYYHSAMLLFYKVHLLIS